MPMARVRDLDLYHERAGTGERLLFTPAPAETCA